MGEALAEGTRWQIATSAVKQLLAHLPPEDIASLGSFAEGLTWWSQGKSIRETMALPLPPVDLSPHGPTNLQHALITIARAAGAEMPRRLIVITDADAQLDAPEKLAAEMAAKGISLHILAIGNGSALGALRKIASMTGGSVKSDSEAKSWASGLLDLSRAAMKDGIVRSELPVRYLAPLSLPPRIVAPWNRVWLKSTATALAEAKSGSEAIYPVARWQVGAGEVFAAGFAMESPESLRLAELAARPPRDPRFRVSWKTGRRLHVSVDALDGKTFLNGQALSLELSNAVTGDAKKLAIPQSGPGRYELSLPAPRAAAFTTVRRSGQWIDQIAIAGRYAPEFDAIGNDHEAMHALAARTGGEVIDVRRTKPIDFHWPRRDVPLESWLAAAGAGAIAIGLVLSRRTA
jgi:hypothetical protein